MNNSIKTAAKTMAAVIAAGAMAVAPVAGTIGMTTMNVMADTVPSASDTGILQVQGVGAGATVNAYKIVTATYYTQETDQKVGFKEWAKVGNIIITDTTNWQPTVEEMPAIVSAVKADTEHTTYTKVGLTYDESTKMYKSAAGSATAGEYLVLVEETNATSDPLIYNPMVVSTYYVDGSLNTNTVIAGKDKRFGSSSTAYAKATDVPLTKTIANPDDQAGLKTGSGDTLRSHGDDLQIGDTGDFEITSTIPAYSSAYTSLKFDLVDTQDAGFDPVTSVVVKVGDTTIYSEDDKTTYPGTGKVTVTKGPRAADSTTGKKVLDSNDFEVSFASDYLKTVTGQNVVVTYSAKLNKNATQKFNPNTNSVELTYTKDISENTDAKTAKTVDYTFPISVLKVDSATTAQTDQDENKTYHDNHEVLSGAEFTLTRISPTATAGTDHVPYPTTGDDTYKAVATTGTDGKVTFNDLDEGIYSISETSAPTGYAINNETFYIKVAPVYNTSTGELESYTITQCKQDGTGLTSDDTTTGSMESSTTRTDNSASDTLIVNDTPMTGLPSTGARSALILTIAGIAVMITVMAASRKKKIAD